MVLIPVLLRNLHLKVFSSPEWPWRSSSSQTLSCLIDCRERDPEIEMRVRGCRRSWTANGSHLTELAEVCLDIGLIDAIRGIKHDELLGCGAVMCDFIFGASGLALDRRVRWLVVELVGRVGCDVRTWWGLVLYRLLQMQLTLTLSPMLRD